MLSHFNLVSNVEQLMGLSGGLSMTEQDVILVHLPLFHIYGMNVLMNPCIAAGATQVMMGRFDMEEFLSLIETHRVTKLFTVPPVGLGLSQYPGVVSRDLTCLEFAMFGAAPLSGELQVKISEVLDCTVIQGYGMTESSPVTNIDFIEPALLKPGSIGPAVSNTEEKIVDTEDPGKQLGPGEIGELMVRGPQVMLGYFNNPEATEETLTEDGWLHTGDIGIMDADGYLDITDRLKDMYINGGFNVYPAEVEQLMLDHPGIAQVAVVGVPDNRMGEVGAAFVVTGPDTGAEGRPEPDEIMSWCRDTMANYKVPRLVVVVDDLPMNASGKVLKFELRDRATALRAT